MVKPLRIGVTGTHSTGKSTFCEAVRRVCEARGLRVGAVGSPGQAARDLGFPILRDHTFESTMWIIAKTIGGELESGLKADVVLADRAVIDAVGYWMAALKTRNETPDPAHLKLVSNFVADYSRTYEILFMTVLDPGLPLGAGRKRDQDAAFRVLAGESIASAVRHTGLSVIELRPETFDACVSRCVDAARRFG